VTVAALEAGVRLHVGLPRHGKTYAARREVFQFVREHPCIVLDQTFEWTRPPGSLVPRDVADVTRRAATVGEAAALVDDGARLVIVSTDADPELVAEAACKWARYYKGRAGVMIGEAHNAFPVNKPLGPHARAVATAFRHWDVAAWLDTQRLSLLNRSWDLAQTIRVFSATDSDFKRLREIGGPALERAVREAGYRNTPVDRGGRGEPGWHVTLYEGVRTGRYELARGAE
jgi:hypothetical protein